MSEASLERSCRAVAARRGLVFLKLFPFIRGVPDRVLLAPTGRFLLAELKIPGGRLSAVQRGLHAAWARLGFNVHVVRDVETFEAMAATLADER